MANLITTVQDIKTHDDHYQTGVFEAVEAGNEAHRRFVGGPISVAFTGGSRIAKPDTSAFFQDITDDLLEDRDPASVAAVESKKLNQEWTSTFTKSLRIGPIAMNENAILSAETSVEAMNRNFGMKAGTALVRRAIHYGTHILRAGANALGNTFDASAATLNANSVLEGFQVLESEFNDISSLFMMPNTFFGLIKNATNDQQMQVNKLGFTNGNMAAFSKPAYIVRSGQTSALYDPGTPDKYQILLLSPNLMRVEITRVATPTFERVGGYENIRATWQSEVEMKIHIRGFRYNGADNPDLATMASASNYTYALSDPKQAGFSMVTVQAAN